MRRQNPSVPLENWPRRLEESVFIDHVLPLSHKARVVGAETPISSAGGVQKGPFGGQGLASTPVSISANCSATLAAGYKLRPLGCFGFTWISSAGMPDSGTQSPTKSPSFRSGDTSSTKVDSGRSLGAQKTVTSIVSCGENHRTNPLPHNANKLVACPAGGGGGKENHTYSKTPKREDRVTAGCVQEKRRL